MLFAGVQDDVPAYMNAFDLFLLPSNFEGSPVTLVEAQGCGVPCLASTNVPDDGAVTGLVHFLPLDAPLAEWAELRPALPAAARTPTTGPSWPPPGMSCTRRPRRMEELYDKLGGRA